MISTPFLTIGLVSRGVEAQIVACFGLPHAMLVNSWTNGAFAALLALGVGPGDEVIVPANSFIGSANVVEMVGVTVVFCHCDPVTLLSTPELIAPHVAERTRAALQVLLYGQMCDVADLARLASERLAPGGRLVTIDPVFAPDQHWIARRLTAADSGQNIRHAHRYEALLRHSFAQVRTQVRHYLLRVPYSCCIMSASLAAA